MTLSSPRALHRPRSLLPLAAILLGPFLAAASASAAELPRFDYQGAAGVCQAASPLYEPMLYARPLGLANISTSTAYVTCAMRGSDPSGQRGAYNVEVNVTNNDTVAKLISCTLVVVYRLAGETVDRTAYVPKTISAGPSGSGFIGWVPTDIIGAFGGPEISKSGISCILPTKTTLQYTGNYYREDVAS